MLSLTCKTAIKAVIYLTLKSSTGEKAGIREIADSIQASEHTVGKLLQTLVRDKIINSSKGPNGGFFLDVKQRNQPIIQVVESIDGKQVFKECGLGLSKCSSSHPCPIHHEYKAIRNEFEKLCREKRLLDLGSPVDGGLAYLFG